MKNVIIVQRLTRLRAFDCKNPTCAEIMEGAPRITDHLCDDCREHYETVKRYLTASGLSFVEDTRLVRGLDYYTRTVFEVQVDNGMGSQNAIGGGGRYDKLAKEVGGRDVPGLGFALGYERCVLALEAAGVEFPKQTRWICSWHVLMTPFVNALSRWYRNAEMRELQPKWIISNAA